MQTETIMQFHRRPKVLGYACAGGKMEFDGPLGGALDLHSQDDTFGMEKWEQSESELQRQTMNVLLKKTDYQAAHIQGIFAGDLQNQCVASAYGLMSFQIPYFGLYGACSTMAESILLSSAMVESGLMQTTAAIASSHFCSAERQFRTPLEYGGQRTPTAQWTVTGAGAVLIGDSGGSISIADVMPGRVIDKGIRDANNMGAAMAPAMIDTLKRYFEESGTVPQDYDQIYSGDLGIVGHDIVMEYLAGAGYDLSGRYNDCGLMIYEREKQDVHAGGSGCGCSAVVLCGHILPQMEANKLHNVLFLCTGAMMSPGSLMQGLAIPAIAHLIHFVRAS